jgi:hypothetical protein
MADNIDFAPLPGAGRPRRSLATEEWQPIMPVPDDAPPGPPVYKRRGKPAGC